MRFTEIKKIILIVFALGLGVLSCVKIYSYDYWTHLFAGRQFFEDATLPAWLQLAYGGEGIYSKIFAVTLFSIRQIGGDGLVSLGMAVVFALVFTFYLAPARKMSGYGFALYLLAVGFVFYYSRIRLVPRPELIAYFLQAAALWLVFSAGENFGRLRAVSVLLLLLTWKVVHVSWFFGLFFVAVYFCLERREIKEYLGRIRNRKVVLTALFAVLLTAWYMLDGVFGTFFVNLKKLAHINEMQPLWVFPEYFYLYLAVFAFLLILLFVSDRIYRRRIVVLSLYCLLGVMIARNSVFFLMAALLFAALSCQNLKPVSRRAARFVTGGCLTAGLLVAVLVALDGDPEWGGGVKHDVLPVAATTYLLDNEREPGLFNDLDWGGYLLWRARGEVRPFLDGRLGGKVEKFDDYERIVNARAPGIVLNRYEIDTILTRGIYESSGRIYPLLFFLNFNQAWALANADDGLLFRFRDLKEGKAIEKRFIWENLLRRIRVIEGLDGAKPHLPYSKGVVYYMLGRFVESRNAFRRAVNEHPELQGYYVTYLQAAGI